MKLLKIITVAQNINTRVDVCGEDKVSKQGNTSVQAL